MKKLTVYLSLFSLAFLAAFIFFNQPATASMEKQVDSHLADINKFIQKQAVIRSEVSLSSNPYDFIKKNEDFNQIVKLGNDVLPILQEKIEKSENNGLSEYILAIAIEEITKTNLKSDEETTWETAKGFTQQWRAYLKNIPDEVERITSSEDETVTKIQQLVSLGTPAIPFIVDKIEAGQTDLIPALANLTSSSNLNTTNVKQWAEQNKQKFENLRQYVTSH